MANKRLSSSSGGSRSRRKKRRYFGPRAPESAQERSKERSSPPARSASAKKLAPRDVSPPPSCEVDERLLSDVSSSSEDETQESDSDAHLVCSTHGNRIVDLSCLQAILDETAVCKGCSCGNLRVSESSRHGLASEVVVSCDSCDFQKILPLSLKKERFHEVNRRSVLAMRRIGRGHAALQKFCGLMNLPPPVTQRAFMRHQKAVASAVSAAARDSMVCAADELKKLHPSGEVPVSFDGTWMKRGFSSMYGAFICISHDTGRVLDFHISGTYCQACSMWDANKENGRVTDEQYLAWKLAHKCSINTERSAPGMESEAACVVWNRSVHQRSLMYTTFIGDGDSKSYRAVCEADPYSGIPITKEECIGHVQKRLGTGLRELKKAKRGEKLSDGKPIGGVGRLTDKTIDTLQSYYGMAIRGNTDNLQAMAKAVWAGIMHKCSTDDEPRHQYCPEGEQSWCGWQRMKAGEQQDYPHTNPLPMAIFDVVKPLYLRLAERQLLERCLRGATQNANESFNSTLWAMCPKEQFCSMETVELAAGLAVCCFNEGAASFLEILERIGCSGGRFSASACEREDRVRVRKADRKSSSEEKERRKKRRRRRKGWQEKQVDAEGVTYQSGGF